MRVNRRGGYDVILRNDDLGAYLGGVSADNLEAMLPIPEWIKDPFLARTADDEDEMLEIALQYDLIGDDGFLIPGYRLERIPWLSDEYLDDDRFYDEAGDYNLPVINKFLFGDHDIYDINPNPYAYRKPDSAFSKKPTTRTPRPNQPTKPASDGGFGMTAA